MVKDTPFEMALNLHLDMDFEIRLVNTHYHWFVVLKVDSMHQVISIEITTMPMNKIVPTIVIYKDECPESILVGTLRLKFSRLVELADRVVEEMGTYSLFSTNCQDFCNRLFKKLDLKTYSTTLGTQVQADADSYATRLASFDEIIPKSIGEKAPNRQELATHFN